jgi:hypothetical protein
MPAVLAIRKRARTYQSPHGPRHNIGAVCARFAISRAFFRFRQKHGWPGLDGKRLAAERMVLPGRGWELTYLESEVEVALQPAAKGPAEQGWLDQTTYRDAEGTWHTGGGTKLKYGLCDAALYIWRKRLCRCLGNRKIRHQVVPRPFPRNNHTVTVYWAEDLKTIANQPKRPTSSEYYKDSEGVWPTSSQIQEDYQVSPSFAPRWRRTPSRLRQGPALRHKWIPNPDPRGRPEVMVHLQEDAERILRGEEARNSGVSRAAPMLEQAKQRAVKILQSILTDGPKPSGEVVKAARLAGLRRHRLDQARVTAKVTTRRHGRGAHWWCLPGQTLPTENEAAAAWAPSLGEPVEDTEPAGGGAEYPGHARKPYRTGAKPDPDTEALYEFCYDEYIVNDRSRRQVLAAARRRFPDNHPTEESTVRLYAARWANRFEPALPLDPTAARKFAEQRGEQNSPARLS